MRKKWEYKATFCSRLELATLLEILGEGGWEAWHMEVTGGHCTVQLKRELLQEEDKPFLAP